MILHGLVVVELNTLRRHWTRTRCLGRGSPGRRYPTCPAGSTTGRAGRWGPKTCIKEHNTGKFKKDVELKPEIRNIMIMNLGKLSKIKTTKHMEFSICWLTPPPCQHMENSFMIFYCLKRISDSFWDFFIFSP